MTNINDNYEQVVGDFGNKVKSFDSQIKEKANETEVRKKNILLNMNDLGQDIKETLTGGNVAVVGVGSTSKNNLNSDLLDKICEREDITNSVNSKNGYYIGNNGVEANTSGLRYKKFAISPNDVFHIKSGIAGHCVNKPVIVFLNSDNELVKAINETSESYERFIYAVAGSCYMCVNIHDTYSNSTKVDKINLTDKNLSELEKDVDDVVFKTQDIIKDKATLNNENLNYILSHNYNTEKDDLPCIQITNNTTFVKNFFYDSIHQFLSKKYFFVGFLIDSTRVGALNTVFTDKDTNSNSVVTMYNEYSYGNFKLYYCKGSVDSNKFIRQINLQVNQDQLFTEPFVFTSEEEITNIEQVIKVFVDYLKNLKTELYVNTKIDKFKDNFGLDMQDYVSCIGDSLTRGVGATNGKDYPSILRTLIAKNVKNVGVGGEKTWDIACRIGAMTMYVEPFTIPSDTSTVPITIKSVEGFTLNLARAVQNETLNPVTIEGVQGNISFNTTENKNYFTRLTNGDTKELVRPTRVTTKFINSYKGSTLVLWSGSNEQVSLDTVSTLIRQQRNIIEHNNCKKYIVIGLTSKYHMPEVDAVNEILAKEYGSHFVDIRKYIMTPINNSIYGLDDYNITPTENDLSRISQGLLPMSLLVDEIHGNDYFYEIVAKQVYQRGKELGYW